MPKDPLQHVVLASFPCMPLSSLRANLASARLDDRAVRDVHRVV
jgi:hypothetical protein